MIGPLARTSRAGRAGATVLGALAVIATAAPVIVDESSVDPTRVTGAPLTPPSWDSPLGTDEMGRSMLALLVWGARGSLTVGLLATVLAIVVGSAVGVIAGHFTGWVGALATGVARWFLTLPSLPLAIALAAVLGPGLLPMVTAIAVTAWPSIALVLRARTFAVESRGYLERAKTLGAGDWHRIRRHVLPDVLPLVLATSTLTMADSVLAEATLAFLGLGDPTRVSWGRTLRDAVDSGAITFGAWWYLIPPGLAVVLVAFACALCGRALEPSR